MTTVTPQTKIGTTVSTWYRQKGIMSGESAHYEKTRVAPAGHHNDLVMVGNGRAELAIENEKSSPQLIAHTRRGSPGWGREGGWGYSSVHDNTLIRYPLSMIPHVRSVVRTGRESLYFRILGNKSTEANN